MSVGLAVVWALLQTVGAGAIGDAVGSLVRGRPGAVAFAVFVAAVVAVLVSAALGGPGLWDLLLLLAAFGLGAVRAAAGAGLRDHLRLLAQIALAWAVAEAGVRLALREPPHLAWPTAGPLAGVARQEPTGVGGNWAIDADVCALAFEDGPVGGVLHFGDSVVHGSGFFPDQRFVAHLAARDPRHVGVAAPGASVDALLLAARRRLSPGVEQAVLYVDLANDLLELDVPLPCCPGGLLDETLRPRCATRRDLGWWRRWYVRSGPPFALRVAAEASRAAHWAWAAWASALRTAAWTHPTSAEVDRAVGRLAGIVAAFAEETRAVGASPVIVLLPDLHVLTGQPLGLRDPERDAAVRAALADLSVPVIDATPFYTAVPDPRARTLDDLHLTPEAHAAFADWLEPRLAALR